jgi:hypothetical protein
MSTMKELILAEIDTYCAERGMSPTAFGLAVRNDPGLVHNLRSGKSTITIDTVDKIRAFIRGERPARSGPAGDPPSTPSDVQALGAVA